MRRRAALASMIALVVLPSIAAAAGFPTGTYTTTLKTPAALEGTWVLTFRPNLSYAITENGKVVVRGHYADLSSSISLARETGPLACAQFGAYTWKRTAKRLVFTRVSDPCQGRRAVLAHPFTALG